MELNDYITDLIVDFDEMGFAPTTLCPDPEAYAIEWRNKITKAFEELTEENERLEQHRKILEAKNERLEIICNSYALQYGTVADKEVFLKEERADTVRKMQEKLKRYYDRNDSYLGYSIAFNIDRVANELLEGINEKVKWTRDWGVYVPLCPYCNELAYEKDHCVFCGKKYEWVEGKHQPTVVEHHGYKMIQGTGNGLFLYKDGRIVMHASCTKKMTVDELKAQVEFFEKIRRDED